MAIQKQRMVYIEVTTLIVFLSKPCLPLSALFRAGGATVATGIDVLDHSIHDDPRITSSPICLLAYAAVTAGNVYPSCPNSHRAVVRLEGVSRSVYHADLTDHAFASS
jgi:hypothetical protein